MLASQPSQVGGYVQGGRVGAHPVPPSGHGIQLQGIWYRAGGYAFLLESYFLYPTCIFCIG